MKLHSFMLMLSSWKAQQIWAQGLNATGQTQKHLPVPGEQHTKQRKSTTTWREGKGGENIGIQRGKQRENTFTEMNKYRSACQIVSLFRSWTPPKDTGFKYANTVTEGLVNTPCSWAAQQPGCCTGWRNPCTVVKKKIKQKQRFIQNTVLTFYRGKKRMHI